MLSRRSLLAGAGAAARTRRPNFLFLIADDHAGYALGCDGNKLAETPNLDKLAAEGTRFSRAYCNSPVCTPSRQSFFTGLLPHAAGVTRLPTSLDPAKPNLAGAFRKAGYQTAVFGKMHLNRPPAPGLYGFDLFLNENEVQRAWARDVEPAPAPPGVATKPVWRPFKDHARIWLNSEKLPLARRDEEMRSTYVARQAARYLEENRGKTFALWVSFQEPHSPFDFPLEDRGRLDPKRFEAPRVGPEDAWQIPLIFRDLTEAEKRGIAAAYYTSVAFLDRNVGRVLDGLERAGLAQDTLVVYLGDNGYNLGHHGRFEKHCGYEQALRVPLIVRHPGRVRRGVADELVELVDATATILDLMNLDPLPGMHGRSLRPYLEGRKPDRPRGFIFSEYLENEEAFLRNERYKFLYCSGRRRRGDGYETDNPTPGRYRRLFDLQRDPGEFTNLAAREPGVADRMESQLLEVFRRTHPEAAREPQRLSRAEAIDWYLRPRDEKA